MAEESPEFIFRQGVTWAEKGEFGYAERCFRRTLELAPDSLVTVLNLGYVLGEQGRYHEALTCYDSILAVSPGYAEARYNRAAQLLRLGRFPEGFADYEARFSVMKQADSRVYAQPRWDGGPLAGKSLLVYCEQGFGDTFMFARYLPLVAAMGANIVLEVQPGLRRLFTGLAGVAEVVEKTSQPPITDCYTPLLSLPHLFATDLTTIPGQAPYLHAPEPLIAKWRQQTAGYTGRPRIGLVWLGKPRPYPNRSCPPHELASLLALDAIHFFSLQVGEQERFPMPRELAEKLIDVTGGLDDFAETAALIATLDLVITIDSAVAHLTGAMGVPVWVMLPANADWRWLLDRQDSPWYPSMRLFRQSVAGDWSGVVAAVVSALEQQILAGTDPAEADVVRQDKVFASAMDAMENGDPSTAIEALTALLRELPEESSVRYNLGRACELADRTVEAVEHYRQAILLRPESPLIRFCLGKLLFKEEQFAEAADCLAAAHGLMPESIDILLDLGAALVQLNREADALECCRKILQLAPDNVSARYNLAYLQLRAGNYRDGFANFEARLRMEAMQVDPREYPQPRWDGSPLNGRSILVFGEQGLGDVIQFARYLPLLAHLGGLVTLEVAQPLISLFEGCQFLHRVVPKTAQSLQTDLHVQIMSLPHLLGVADMIPPAPYITPDLARSARWRQLLADDGQCRIGLVWRGNPRNTVDRKRSCSIEQFSRFASVAGASFYSLQVGENLPAEAGVWLKDYTDRLVDLAETAALIANLDLVISVDTAVSHLAGAMGTPTMLLIPAVYDWRWLPDRQDSPWYRAMRIFRQPRHGAWDAVITEVTDALEQWLAGRRP